MSYCRFGEHSDVYAYIDDDDKYICFMCSLEKELDEHVEFSIDGMISHLNEHVSNGDKVPQKAFDRLNEERI
jgi:hypothetical protein